MPSITESRLHVSEIAPHLVQSEIRSMTVECDRIGGVNLAQGVCDTELPAPVHDAAIEAIQAGHNIYTRLDGIAPLRAAISRKLAEYNRVQTDPETQVLVTSGATGAMYAACLALFNPGDEIILFEPFYGYHVNTMLSLRIKPRAQPLAAGTWELDVDALRAAITPKTRAILINTPSNPCGKVFTRAEIEAIGEIAIEHDLFLLTDEIYEYFLFDGAKHTSASALPGLAERTILISGFSKTFSITGWRIGYLAADARWIPPIGYFHDLTYVCSPSPAQYGAVAGLAKLDASFYRHMSTDYQRKRDLLCSALDKAGLTPSVPQGAYYVLADVTLLPGANARDKARALLAKTGVAAVAGSAFYSKGRGENLLRFCFAKQDAALEEACQRLTSANL
ncbi:MAG: Aspartate transaminase [Acidobacteriaceae bacterium]|nr:Aspartate transaminase [Acidobacteriaceae bacterium]